VWGALSAALVEASKGGKQKEGVCMSSYSFQLPMPKGVALMESANRVLQYLTGHGYKIKSDNRPKNALLEREGSNMSMKDHKNPHELKIVFSDAEMSFNFKVVSFWKDGSSSDNFSTIFERAKDEVVRKCSKCAEFVRADAKVCRYCQTSL
jgi:hypothetical protein